jgi:molybdopterin-guanine dinucleotide biosynthesis protein A
MKRCTNPVSGLILAGGQSRRMGANKAFLEVGGRPIIERVIEQVALVSQEILLLTNTPDEYAHLGYPTVPDAYPGQGSLVGIYSGLEAASHPVALVVACDMPFLNASLLRHMISLAPGHDAIVPRTKQGVEPLHALYSKACLPAMEGLLQRDNLKVIAFYSQVQVRYVEQEEIETLDPQHLSFFNVNSPADLQWARRMAARVGST